MKIKYTLQGGYITDNNNKTLLHKFNGLTFVIVIQYGVSCFQ